MILCITCYSCDDPTNGKTNCSIFKKHFVPGLPLLTQNKMCILLQKIQKNPQLHNQG